MTDSAASATGTDKTRIGASIFASRNCAPSSTSATASDDAPASIAARPIATAPCPYPSAFTTAQTLAGATRARNAATFARTASRSISAQTGRYMSDDMSTYWSGYGSKYGLRVEDVARRPQDRQRRGQRSDEIGCDEIAARPRFAGGATVYVRAGR